MLNSAHSLAHVVVTCVCVKERSFGQCVWEDCWDKVWSCWCHDTTCPEIWCQHRL